MKKYIVASLLLGTVALAGCEMPDPMIKYNGDYEPTSVVEERIEDLIEDENPELDFEVRIVQESEED